MKNRKFGTAMQRLLRRAALDFEALRLGIISKEDLKHFDDRGAINILPLLDAQLNARQIGPGVRNTHRGFAIQHTIMSGPSGKFFFPSTTDLKRYTGAVIRQANARNGVGRPPRNKVAV